MREIPPIMVLSEDTPEHITFRFKGNAWATATFAGGLALLLLTAWLHAQRTAPTLPLAVLGTFGVLLLYSTLYSLTAHQWLTLSKIRRTLRFHKKNLYGRVDWERPARDFRCIRVGRRLKASNWHITLVCQDGLELELGESFLGAPTHARALDLAGRISGPTGIAIESSTPA